MPARRRSCRRPWPPSRRHRQTLLRHSLQATGQQEARRRPSKPGACACRGELQLLGRMSVVSAVYQINRADFGNQGH